MRIIDLWNELEAYLSKVAPRALETLNPPATASEIRSLESAVGKAVPVQLKEYFQVHNGQSDPNRLDTLCEEGTLLSTESAVEAWRVLNRINDDLQVRASGQEWWNRRFLPLTDCEGDHLALDLDSGGIVMHVHDAGIEHGIAPDLQSWLREKLEVFQEGRFTVEDGYLIY